MKKLNIDEKQVISMYLEVMNTKKVADELNVSSESVRRVLVKHGISRYKRDYIVVEVKEKKTYPTDDEVLEAYRENGYSQKQTAVALGVSQNFIHCRVKKYDAKRLNGGTPIKVTDEQLRELVNAGLTRQEIATLLNMHVESLPRRLRRLGLSMEYSDANCIMCGKRFKSYHNSQTYCNDCQAEYLKTTSYRRRCRKFGVLFDPSVTRDEVIKRDHNICQICGIKCNPDDKSWGSYGATYPTLDHIIPLSKGGAHTWNNVQCACAMCNSKKRDII